MVRDTMSQPQREPTRDEINSVISSAAYPADTTKLPEPSAEGQALDTDEAFIKMMRHQAEGGFVGPAREVRRLLEIMDALDAALRQAQQQADKWRIAFEGLPYDELVAENEALRTRITTLEGKREPL